MKNSGVTSTLKKRTVLAVHHDAELLRILEVNLTHASMDVVLARNGAQALSSAQAHPPDLILLGDELPDFGADEVRRRLKASRHTSNVPVLLISDNRSSQAPGRSEGVIASPFEPRDVVAAVKASLRLLERTENINPLTSLPNQAQVISELTDFIENGAPFTAIYVDLDSLTSFNRRYGFADGDRLIRLVAEILHEAVHLFGDPNDLVAHAGGDDFIVVTNTGATKAICRKIIADFDARTEVFYSRVESESGSSRQQSGPGDGSAVVSIKAAVVSSDGSVFHNHLDVSEQAARQMDILRRLPGSNCYFDLREIDLHSRASHLSRGVPDARYSEGTALRQELDWVAFLARELDIPVAQMANCLDRIYALCNQSDAGVLRTEAEALGESLRQLSLVADELGQLTRGSWLVDGLLLDEVDVRQVVTRVVQRVGPLLEQRNIQVTADWVGDAAQCRVQAVYLTQALFYALRSMIKFSSSGDRICVEMGQRPDGCISIAFKNGRLLALRRALAALLQGLPGIADTTGQSDLWLANALTQIIGGRLLTEGQRDNAPLTIVVPKTWSSWRRDINNLVGAAETSRSEAREQLREISRLLRRPEDLSSPGEADQRLDALSGKVQELVVLCNRSLFLADESGKQIEAMRDRLLQEDVAHAATAEAILIASREIAAGMHVGTLFDLDRAQRASKYALAVASELLLSSDDRQALHRAALLKDLALVLSPGQLTEQRIVPTLDKAIALGVRFNPLWKALQRMDFLAPALALIARYREKRSPESISGIEVDSVSKGVCILDLVNMLDSLASDASAQRVLPPSVVAEMIASESGRRLDPEVVNAFLRVWERNGTGVPWE